MSRLHLPKISLDAVSATARNRSGSGVDKLERAGSRYSFVFQSLISDFSLFPEHERNELIQ